MNPDDMMKMAELFLDENTGKFNFDLRGIQPLMTYNRMADIEADKLERAKAKEVEIKQEKKYKLLCSAINGADEAVIKRVNEKKIEHDIENKTLDMFVKILDIVKEYESDITKLKDDINFAREIQQRSKIAKQMTDLGYRNYKTTSELMQVGFDNETFVGQNWGLKKYLSVTSNIKNEINETIK